MMKCRKRQEKKKNSRARFAGSLMMGLLVGLYAGILLAQPAPRSGSIRLSFKDVPLDMVLEDYSEKTGRVLLRSPKLPTAKITLRSQGELKIEEYLDAIEHILGMNGVSIMPVGDKFLKVVPSIAAMQEPMQIRDENTEESLEEKGRLVSQLITLKHMELADAEKAVGPLRHTEFGKIHYFEGINSMLVTDTEASIKRIMDILEIIDRPAAAAREVPNIIVIRYAKAEDIKKKLEEIIKNSQEEAKKSTAPRQRTSGPPGVERASIPGVIRARRQQQEAAASVSELDLIAEAERGVIRGNVHIVADDRTNIMIIITRPENMKFFEKIVQVLDVETSPDVVVKVVRLEYADVENVATMLNNLIGKKDNKDQAKSIAATRGVEEGKSVDLNEYISSREKTIGTVPEKQSKAGELSSENIKILANKRTNALIIMASKADMAMLEEIIKDMDMVLSQVLIEAVILEIQLGGSIQTGIDWIQRSMIAYNEKDDGTRKPRFSYAGGGGAGDMAPLDATALQSVSSLSGIGSGLTYYFTHFGLNLDAVLHMASGDNRTRIISSPVIVTHDNTEATIDSSEERYFYKGKRWVGSSTSDGRYEDDVERRKVGIHLTVTPHINKKKLVVMDISQQVEQLTEGQTIGDNTWPTVLARELKASISVQDRETIVLGGLVKQQQGSARRGIPFLSRIPILGWLFGYKKSEKLRSELIVFITPYVLDTPEAIAMEAARRKAVIDTKGLWEKGWSDSDLADTTKHYNTIMGKVALEAAINDKARSEEVLPDDEAEQMESAPLIEEEKEPVRVEVDHEPTEEDVVEIIDEEPVIQAETGVSELDLDPELMEFIGDEAGKWDKLIENVDKHIDAKVKEMEEVK